MHVLDFCFPFFKVLKLALKVLKNNLCNGPNKTPESTMLVMEAYGYIYMEHGTKIIYNFFCYNVSINKVKCIPKDTALGISLTAALI